MNTKTKSSLVIIGTLLIGMVLGSVITGAVMRNRVFDRMERLRTMDGFRHRMEKIIQPDEDQRAKVHEILKEHFSRMQRLGETMRQDFEARNDSLYKELDEVLRPDQIERLKDRMKRLRRFAPPGGDHRPPHDRPPRHDDED